MDDVCVCNHLFILLHNDSTGFRLTNSYPPIKHASANLCGVLLLKWGILISCFLCSLKREEDKVKREVNSKER